VGDIERLEDDEYIREILEMRSRARHEEASRLYQAEMRGIEKGIEEGKERERIEIAKKMLQEGLILESIVKLTGLSIENLQKIQNTL